MIEDEEQPQLLNTIGEYPTEEVGTIEEDIYVLGVESLNGKTGDLSIKTINGEDLVEEGNIDLQTPLDSDQMAAVNSGIDAEKVSQIATNTQNITTLQNTKQDKLTQTQLNAVNSGIDQTKVAQIATNTSNITSNTNRITTIEGKIPSAASSSNKLTDKNYVDNAIATNTANYISDNGQPFQSYADLVAYSGPLTNNDYAFVETIDQAGNDIYTRYKYNADQNLWAEEYTITNPYFTSDQWAAINSGVTQNDVNQINTNKGDIADLQTSKQDALSQTQLDAINSGIDAAKVQQIADNTTAIATKQDKLVAGANIQIGSDGKTISATDTTYTAGTGLTLTGTQFSVTEPVPAGFFTDTAAEQTGTGSSFTLNNTVDAPIDKAEPKGDTYQYTTTGKNLMPMATADMTGEYENRQRDFRIDLPIGTYTVSFDLSSFERGTNTSFGVFMKLVYGDGTQYDPAIIMIDSSTTAGRKSFTFTTTKVVSSDASLSRSNIRIAATNWNNGARASLSNIQIESGSTDTSYEPYTAGASPNPSYPQQIDTVTGEQTVEVRGKNWLSHTEDNWSFSSGNNQIGQTASRYAEWGEVVGGQTYVMSRKAVGTSSYWIAAFFTSQPTIGSVATGFDRPTNYNSTSYSFNVPAGTKYVVIFYGSGLSEEGQLEIGSTATAYQPYQAQTYKVNLGKNLLNPSSTTKQSSSATKTIITDGLRVTTSDSGNYTWVAFAIGPRSQFAGKTLVMKGNFIASSSNKGSFGIGYSNADVSSRSALGNIATSGDSKAYTITDDDPTKPYIYAIFYANAGGTASANDYVDYTNIQLEVGSQATTYAPYFTPIELCKIGTYQDYIYKSNGNWYKHAEIYRLVLDGTEDWKQYSSNVYINTGTIPAGVSISGSLKLYGLSDRTDLTTTNLTYNAAQHTGLEVRNLISYWGLAGTTPSDWKTWLSTHNTTVYYALETATDTAITDAALIAQLEALGSSTTYSPQTNYSVLTPTPNLPAILTVDVFKNNYAGLLARLEKAGA